MVRVRLESIGTAGTVPLTGEAHHYLVHVLRLAVGDRVELFDDQGNAHAAELIEISQKRALLRVGPRVMRPVGAPVGIVPCLTKVDRFEWLLQKGTELGARCFAPAFSARSAIKLSADKAESRLKRWRRIVQEAARQSGRADVPMVLSAQPLQSAAQGALAAMGDSPLLLVLDEAEPTRRLSQPLSSRAQGRSVVIVVGPEGGWTRAEVASLEQLNGVPVSLGPRVLRAETAPLAALAIILHAMGELG